MQRVDRAAGADPIGPNVHGSTWCDSQGRGHDQTGQAWLHGVRDRWLSVVFTCMIVSSINRAMLDC